MLVRLSTYVPNSTCLVLVVSLVIAIKPKDYHIFWVVQCCCLLWLESLTNHYISREIHSDDPTATEGRVAPTMPVHGSITLLLPIVGNVKKMICENLINFLKFHTLLSPAHTRSHQVYIIKLALTNSKCLSGKSFWSPTIPQQNISLVIFS